MILHDFTDSLLFQIDRSEDVFVECLVCVISEAVLRAQDKFWTVTGHDARSKKFLLNQISFLASQNIGKKVNLSLCNFLFVNVILLLQREDSQVRILLFFQDNFELHTWPIVMTGKWSFWPKKLPFWLDIIRWTAIISSPGSCGCCLTMHYFFSLCCAFQ